MFHVVLLSLLNRLFIKLLSLGLDPIFDALHLLILDPTFLVFISSMLVSFFIMMGGNLFRSAKRTKHFG